jgi:uncharacterized protein
MRIELTPLEARVIGCLVEKEITTPDQYPLSLNALVTACNQKSNRDPVLELDPRAVQDTVDGLMKKHLVTDRSGGVGGRVTRYRHRFCNTQFSQLSLSAGRARYPVRAVAARCRRRLASCAAAPAAWRRSLTCTRSSRRSSRSLAARKRWWRSCHANPVKRESRWLQLFTGEALPEPAAARDGAVPRGTADAARVDERRDERLDAIEARVDALQHELEALQRKLDAFSARLDPGE